MRECLNSAANNLVIKIVEEVAQENSKGFVFCFHFGGYQAMRRAKGSAAKIRKKSHIRKGYVIFLGCKV